MGFDDDDEMFRRRMAGETPVEVPVTTVVPAPARTATTFLDRDVATVDGEVVRESDRAVQIRFAHNGVGRQIWFPRGQIERGFALEKGDRDLFRIRQWIYRKKINEPPEDDNLTSTEKEARAAELKRLLEAPRSPLPPRPALVQPPAPPGRLDLSDEEFVRGTPAHVANDWNPADHRTPEATANGDLDDWIQGLFKKEPEATQEADTDTDNEEWECDP